MRSGRSSLAFPAICGVRSWQQLQLQESRRLFFTMTSKGMFAEKKKNIALAAVSHTNRSLHLSPVLYTAAETSAGSNSNNGTNSASGGETALDVAMRVNKLKRLHQTGGGPDGKKRIELDAWNELNSLTEEQINVAEGKEVSLLLNSWAYFAKYWEKGRDGPVGAAGGSPVESQSPSATETTPQHDRSETA